MFQAFHSLSWNNIRSFLSLGLESSTSRNIRNFLRVGSFYFSSLQSYFLKYERNKRLKNSISGNVRKFYYARVLNIPFPKYKKSSVFFLNIRDFSKAEFFRKKYKKGLESIRNFIILGLESFISRIIRKTFWENKNFFYGKILRLVPKSVLGSYICKTFHSRCLTVIWICQGSEYTFPEYKKNAF